MFHKRNPRFSDFSGEYCQIQREKSIPIYTNLPDNVKKLLKSFVASGIILMPALPEKDRMMMENCRPVSVMNKGCKILHKILAKILQKQKIIAMSNISKESKFGVILENLCNSAH